MLSTVEGQKNFEKVTSSYLDCCAKLCNVLFSILSTRHQVNKPKPTPFISNHVVSSQPSEIPSAHVSELLLLGGRKLRKYSTKLCISRLGPEETQQRVLRLIVTSPVYSIVFCTQSHELSLGHARTQVEEVGRVVFPFAVITVFIIELGCGTGIKIAVTVTREELFDKHLYNLELSRDCRVLVRLRACAGASHDAVGLWNDKVAFDLDLGEAWILEVVQLAEGIDAVLMLAT